ncbi:hypothetical protein VNO77_05000 [Canavalia gladiata]|uniref:WAPL domain-containing protein n=1 Tax=Canavalia gladiata TaxID=3824 RepID=A0AAN9MXJ0_CANGL
MIVRTYGRRNRTISGTCSGSSSINDDVSEPFSRDSLSQETDPLCGFAFSSQDSSSHWSLFDSEPSAIDDLYGGGRRESKKARRAAEKKAATNRLSIPATATLMEAQEFGEMMEHVDEVNFALDGLRRGQPLRIRRASLVSLMSICATTHQRRLLRAQGMAKTIIDAILGLSLDDSPSNLAAATLFYILTNDGQDDHLLESPGCVQFLMKLLKPIVSTAVKDKAPKFGYKLLSLRPNDDMLKNTTGRLDSSSVAVFSRVQEILVNIKELKTSQNDSGVERPELCPKWLALLTIEKACLSAISLDETTGAVRKAGGNFKEKLREHGGLDAVFEVTMNCHSDLENWMEDRSLSTKASRKDKCLKSLTLLLKCLKIMENATFLSKDNQTHLLGMKRKFSHQATPFSFTELIITVIKILSDLCLRRSTSAASNDNKPHDPFSMVNSESELDQLRDYKENKALSISSSRKYHGAERASSVKSSIASQNSRLLTCAQLESSLPISETPSTSTTDTYSLKMRVSSSTSGSCGASKNAYCKTSMIQNSTRKNVRFMESTPVIILDDSQDPFAFDEDDIAPSKWDLLSGKQKKSRSKKHEVGNREFENECQSQTNVSQQEISNGDSNCSSSDVGDEEASSLLTDCLLTAVKVLMNLTNDNPVGCQQIAMYGGLETMSMLIAGHFPSFSLSSFPRSNENASRTAKEHEYDRHLTDHELDFLVAILGLLVNLVEKDGRNRSRLAAASVLLPSSDGLDQEIRRDVIQLLCSIFLANQGESEGAEEDKHLLLNDEAAVLQGEKEAEKMIVEAYSALLLAFLSTESNSIRAAIADNLPDHNLASLVPVLDRFVEFHLSLNMISPETHKAVSEVIESCRIR